MISPLIPARPYGCCLPAPEDARAALPSGRGRGGNADASPTGPWPLHQGRPGPFAFGHSIQAAGGIWLAS